MIPKVNRWISGAWNDPEGPITYDVLHAQPMFKQRSQPFTRMDVVPNGVTSDPLFIGYCHDEYLLYYDVYSPAGRWTRHAAAGVNMLDVPQYSIDEEWKFDYICGYNAAFDDNLYTSPTPLIIKGRSENTWNICEPKEWREDILASLKRTNKGIETTGLKFKLCAKQDIKVSMFGWDVSAVIWNQGLDKMDAVRNVLYSHHKTLFDLERLGFGVEKFENILDNIECTSVTECIEYLIDNAGCTNEDSQEMIVYLIEEEFKKRYRVTMSIGIDKSLKWMRDRKAARGDNRKAMGDLSVLPNDVLDKIFAGLLLH